MFRIVGGLVVFVGIVCLSVLTAALTISQETEVAVAVVTPGGVYLDREYRIQLIDLNRRLTLDIEPMLPDVVDVELMNDGENAFILTQRGDERNFMTYLVLYHYNLGTGEQTELYNATVLNEGVIRIRGIEEDFAPRYSPDGQWLAFFDRETETMHIVEQATHETVAMVDVLSLNTAQAPYWNTKSEQIAVRNRTNGLLIVNADGSRAQQFNNLERGMFFPDWSEDGESILIQYFNSVANLAMPLHIVDVGTGELNDFAEGINGYGVNWCGNRWVSYLELEGNRSMPSVLDLEDGSSWSLADHDLLRDETIASMHWSPGCEGVFMVGEIRTLNEDYSRIGQLIYFTDRGGRDVQIIHESDFIVEPIAFDDGMVYRTRDAQGRFTMFRLFYDDADGPRVDQAGNMNNISAFGLPNWFDGGILYQAVYGVRRQLVYKPLENDDAVYLTSADDDVIDFVVIGQ